MAGDTVDPAALYRLQAWLSPAFPVGAFTCSHGIEWAVEAGDIVDAATLSDWLGVVVGQGGGFIDAALFCEAHDAVTAADDERLRDVAELAAAFVPSRERHLETTAQGDAFVAAVRASWPCAALDRLVAVRNTQVAYPVAVAVAAAGHGIGKEPALAAFLQAIVANLVSAGVRLIPLGQTDGLKTVASFESVLARVAARALATHPDDLAGTAFRSDLAAMRHETQYTRLFRT
jgi:urease accessory protein